MHDFNVPTSRKIKSPMKEDFVPTSVPDDVPDFAVLKANRSLVYSLLWLARTTRPDVYFHVRLLTHFVHISSKENFTAAKRILLYLHTTLHFRLKYFKRNTEVLPFYVVTDSDHAGDVLDRNSVHGSLHFLYGNLLHWTSMKARTSTPLHSSEAEYVGLSEACTLG